MVLHQVALMRAEEDGYVKGLRDRRQYMIDVAKLEMDQWTGGKWPLKRGMVLAILFAFVHRVTTGDSLEETFFKVATPQPDYEI